MAAELEAVFVAWTGGTRDWVYSGRTGAGVQCVGGSALMMRRKGPWSATRVGLVCAFAGLFVFVGGYNYPRGWWLKEFVFEVYPNSGADLVGASIVILLVDRFARLREDEERRRQLIRECASSDHSVASRALLELGTRGWLAEGALVEAHLVGANLSGAQLSAVDLAGADLVGANLEGADLSRASLIGARLNGARLERALLEWVIANDAKLGGAVLRGADASGAQLIQADLSHADLRGADFSRANLSGADMSFADLCGCDFSAAVLDSASLRSVRHDPTTRWPAGYPGGEQDGPS